MTNELPSSDEVAVLAGGCFWCIEAVFLELQGVQSVESGYMGGFMENPSYRDICTGKTGHAEVVRIAFDPAVLPFRDLLGVFFAIHDPTTLNRQENDIGTQYRSAIFYTSEEQKKVADELIAALSAEAIYTSPIVTEVTPASVFYRAEDYHQDYYQSNPYQPYCQFVVEPKLKKFRERFASKRKSR